MSTQYQLLKMHYEQLLEEKEQLEKKVSQLEKEIEDLEDKVDELDDIIDDFENWQKVQEAFKGMDLNNLDTIMKIESFVQYCYNP